MIWTILAMVFSGMAGFTYGRLFGINLMLQLGEELYPDFKSKLTKKVMEEADL